MDEHLARIFASNLVLMAITRLNLLLIIKSARPQGLQALLVRQREAILEQVRLLPMEDPIVHVMLDAVRNEFQVYEEVAQHFGQDNNGASIL